MTMCQFTCYGNEVVFSTGWGVKEVENVFSHTSGVWAWGFVFWVTCSVFVSCCFAVRHCWRLFLNSIVCAAVSLTMAPRGVWEVSFCDHDTGQGLNTKRLIRDPYSSCEATIQQSICLKNNQSINQSSLLAHKWDSLRYYFKYIVS